MKNSVKSGLSFGIIMGAWYIVSDLFIFNSGENSVWISIISGVIGGAIAGVLFGVFTGLFTNKLERSVQPDLDPGEEVLFQTNANHFKGIEAVGGKLFLTDKRLLFKSHSFNLQKHTLSIPSEQIRGTERYKTLGIANNGLKVITDSTTEKFVVDKVEEWQKILPGSYTVADNL